MRKRAWLAWGVLTLGLALGVAGQGLPGGRAWNLLAGLCLIGALVLGLTLLPWWSRWRPTAKPLPGLFAPPRRSERWCSRCGSRTPRKGACKLCGHTPVSIGRSRGN